MNLKYTFGCTEDAVDIYDGNSTDAPFISANCENNPAYLPGSVLSSTKDLYIVFHSGDNAAQNEGFELQYEADTCM